MKNKKQNWINLFKEQKANNQIKVYVKHPYLLIEDTLPKFIVDYIKQEKKNKVFSATFDEGFAYIYIYFDDKSNQYFGLFSEASGIGSNDRYFTFVNENALQPWGIIK